MKSVKNYRKPSASENKNLEIQKMSNFFKLCNRWVLKPGLQKLFFLFVISFFCLGQALASKPQKNKDIPKTCVESEENNPNRTCLTQKEKQDIEQKLNTTYW